MLNCYADAMPACSSLAHTWPALATYEHSAVVKHRAYKSALELRFRVYCLECNFLSPDDYPDGMETDEHDDDAAHFYAFDDDDELAGYVRLIHSDVGSHFPIRQHCRITFDEQMLPVCGQTAEISRLMVRKDYRRRRSDRLSGVTVEQNRALFAGERRHEASGVLLSLYRQMYAYSLESGIRFWYAAMERPLARSLQRLSFSFRSIGPQTDYYGPVSPYLADLRELEAFIGQRNPRLLEWFRTPERRNGKSTHGDDWGLCHLPHGSFADRGETRDSPVLV